MHSKTKAWGNRSETLQQHYECICLIGFCLKTQQQFWLQQAIFIGAFLVIYRHILYKLLHCRNKKFVKLTRCPTEASVLAKLRHQVNCWRHKFTIQFANVGDQSSYCLSRLRHQATQSGISFNRQFKKYHYSFHFHLLFRCLS